MNQTSCSFFNYLVAALFLTMIPWVAIDAKPKKQTSAPVVLEDDDEVGDISGKVQNEIKRQLREQERKEHKERLYRPVWQKGENGGFLVYKVPALPFHVTPYEQRDLLQLAGTFENANEAYSSHGTAHNLSKLLFGEQPIKIQDILLVSKLLQRGVIDRDGDPNNTYLKHLALQEIYFKATLQRYEVFLGYTRHFWKGEVSFGLQVPVVMLHNTLKLGYNLSDVTKTVLNRTVPAAGGGHDQFPLEYQNSFDNFIADVLDKKGIDFNSNSTTIGFGDVLAFINCEFKSPRFDRGMIGASLCVPTAKQRDTGKLWDPEKGNGGLVQTSAFGSLLWSVHRFFNPYIYAQGTYSFPVSLQRRVPKYFKEKLADNAPVGGYLILGNNLLVNGANLIFNDLDSTIRGFADGTTKVTINRGIEVGLKVGDIIERVLFERGFLDLHAQFRFKGKDFIGGRRNDDEYNTSILTQNTNEVGLTLGAQFNYQHDENFRSWLGGRFVVTGKNVPRTLGIDAGLNIEF